VEPACPSIATVLAPLLALSARSAGSDNQSGPQRNVVPAKQHTAARPRASSGGRLVSSSTTITACTGDRSRHVKHTGGDYDDPASRPTRAHEIRLFSSGTATTATSEQE
jgi:hypothetical protein